MGILLHCCLRTMCHFVITLPKYIFSFSGCVNARASTHVRTLRIFRSSCQQFSEVRIESWYFVVVILLCNLEVLQVSVVDWSE